jgi:hypothetical protein
LQIAATTGTAVHFTTPAWDAAVLPPESITWDFGDDSTKRPGFHAAHVYERPGVYRVTRDGQLHAVVTVAPHPVDKIVRLEAGEIVVREPLRYPPNTVVLGHPHPDGTTLVAAPGLQTLFAAGENLTVRNLTVRGSDDELRRAVRVFDLNGSRGLTIDNLTVDRVGHVLLGDSGSEAADLYARGVRTVGPASLGNYGLGSFGKLQGAVLYDWSIHNSIAEHGVRLAGGTERVTVHGGRLGNVAGESYGGSRWDNVKSCLTGQDVRGLWVEGVDIAGGVLSVGTIPINPDEAHASHVVFRGNRFVEGGRVEFRPRVRHARLVVAADDWQDKAGGTHVELHGDMHHARIDLGGVDDVATWDSGWQDVEVTK